MVISAQAIDFIECSRMYVPNNMYPSIHVYTTDAALINFAVEKFNARVLPHKGTNDVVISRRDDLFKAAVLIAAHGTRRQRPPAMTLMRYCKATKIETRRREVARLVLQLKRLRMETMSLSGGST